MKLLVLSQFKPHQQDHQLLYLNHKQLSETLSDGLGKETKTIH